MALCAITTEASEKILTEDGDTLVYEPTVVCADADLPWEEPRIYPGTEVLGREYRPVAKAVAVLDAPAATPALETVLAILPSETTLSAVRDAEANRIALEAAEAARERAILDALIAEEDELLLGGAFAQPHLLYRISN